jgi:hypothetical protein
VFALKLLSRFIITFLLFLLLFQTVKAQEPARLISTLNNGGSSNTITIDSRKYYFQQSIGQSGIIGLSGGKKQILRQGFIQPPAGTVKNNLTENLPVEIYPNPFTTSIILSCPEKVSENLYVTIYDLNGKIVYLKKFGTSRELNLDLSDLTPSIYILRVNTTTRWFFSKVIKLPN